MTNTDILLEDLEDVLDDATSMPMTKKSLVDVDKIKTIIEDIRLNTPQETKQAKAIVDSRNNILDEAKKEAAKIISEAQAQARELVPIALMAALCVVGRTAFALIPLPNLCKAGAEPGFRVAGQSHYPGQRDGDHGTEQEP